jgi:hypothetical protein
MDMPPTGLAVQVESPECEKILAIILATNAMLLDYLLPKSTRGHCKLNTPRKQELHER